MSVLGYIVDAKTPKFLGKQSLIGYVAFALWCVVSLLSLEQCLPGNVACGLHLLDQVGSLNTNYTSEKLGMVINPNTMALYGICVFLFLFFWKMKHEKHEKHPRSLTVVAPFPRDWGAPKGKDPLPSINPAGHRSLGPRRMSRFQQLLPPKNACDIATGWNGMDGGWWCRCNCIVCFF